MSTEFLVFFCVYGLALVAASLIVLTPKGQALLLCSVERLGKGLGAGPWSLLDTFGHEVPGGTMRAVDRPALAESYVASAETETLAGARVTLWVLIGGFVASALAAIVIIGVLPPLVESGQWSYATYLHVATFVVYGAAVGGLAAGAVLVAWLLRRTVRLNLTDGCVVTRELVLAAREAGLESDLQAEIDSGAYPLMNRWLTDVT